MSSITPMRANWKLPADSRFGPVVEQFRRVAGPSEKICGERATWRERTHLHDMRTIKKTFLSLVAGGLLLSACHSVSSVRIPLPGNSAGASCHARCEASRSGLDSYLDCLSACPGAVKGEAECSAPTSPPTELCEHKSEMSLLPF